jgi:hypothetical protein
MTRRLFDDPKGGHQHSSIKWVGYVSSELAGPAHVLTNRSSLNYQLFATLSLMMSCFSASVRSPVFGSITQLRGGWSRETSAPSVVTGLHQQRLVAQRPKRTTLDAQPGGVEKNNSRNSSLGL